jgi:hypothetical protein
MRLCKLFPDRCLWTEAERLSYAKEIFFLHRCARKPCSWQLWDAAGMQMIPVAARRDLARQALFYICNRVPDWNPDAEVPPARWFRKYWQDQRNAVERADSAM